MGYRILRYLPQQLLFCGGFRVTHVIAAFRNDPICQIVSNQSFIRKTEIAVISQNQVIQHFNIQQLPCRSEFLGQVDIILAGLQVVGRMVVGQDKG
jgi:hypothetical protein